MNAYIIAVDGEGFFVVKAKCLYSALRELRLFFEDDEIFIYPQQVTVLPLDIIAPDKNCIVSKVSLRELNELNNRTKPS